MIGFRHRNKENGEVRKDTYISDLLKMRDTNGHICDEKKGTFRENTLF